MLEFLKYLIYGWIILIVAIPVNFIAKEIGLITWYGFLVFKDSIGFLDVVFMFIVYPLILGASIGLSRRFVLSRREATSQTITNN